jgi:hypothetical protein
MILKLRFLLLASAALAGCSAPRPEKLSWYEPADAATKAIDMYDTDSDGQLSADELKASPGLSHSWRRLDTNRDSNLSAEEIRTRFEELHRWVKYNGLDLTVLSRGRPASGAQVTLVPEPFMGDDFPTYRGTVMESGSCPLAADDRYLPVPVGFYTLKIVHAEKETVRGVEIATDTTGSRMEVKL